MTKITRLNQNERLSRIVIHGETVYIAGITSAVDGDIKTQTRDVLMRILAIVTGDSGGS